MHRFAIWKLGGRLRRRRLLIPGAAVLAAALLGIAGWRSVSRQMASLPLARSASAIYTRARILHVGQPLTGDGIGAMLDRIGYRRVDSLDAPGSYTSGDGRISILQTSRLKGRTALDIFLSGTGDSSRVTGLFEDGARVGEVRLAPEHLAHLRADRHQLQRRVAFNDLPPGLVKAVLTAEDRKYFLHPGLNPLSVIRAALADLSQGNLSQGGSTITQQLVKNSFLTSERTFARKLAEAVLSLAVELRFTKQEILEAYANSVYLGQVGGFGILGFAQAADIYFGKHLKDLTEAEFALLAGMIRSPNRTSPFRHPKVAVRQRNRVLARQLRTASLPAGVVQAAMGRPLGLAPPDRYNYAAAPHFVDYVRETLSETFDENTDPSGVRVYTTLQPELQQAAFEAVREGMKGVDRQLKASGEQAQAAVVAVDPNTGDILAMVGGRDYVSAQFNRAVHARRQPGSAFKPFVYAAALDSETRTAYTLSTRLMDAPSTFAYGTSTYSPENFQEEYRGPVSLRDALAHSLNVPTVDLARKVGLDATVSLAKRMGLDSRLRPFPSLALGAFEVTLLELAGAYVPFANGGFSVPLRAVNALEGAAVRPQTDRKPVSRALPAPVAFLITSALGSALDYGTGKAVRDLGFPLPAAGKTGTSRDAWFVGYTPEILCAVWVGRDSGQDLGLTGAVAALPIWTRFMQRAQDLGFLSGQPFPVPEGVDAIEIDPETALPASRDCERRRTEYYRTGTAPTQLCGAHGQGVWGWIARLLGGS